jgi:hypothetical protein
MKKLLLCLCTSFTLCHGVSAQADIETMLKQIAKLEIYIVDLEKGYKIAQEGLTTIGEIKKGEFNLHSLFFSSLETVNPSVAKYSKIAVIIADQLSIVSAFKSLIHRLNSSGKLTSSEIQYIQTVYTHITDECSKSLNALIAVTTDGKLQMTDDERIRRIDGIYDDMNDRYAFTQHFTAKAEGVVSDRGYASMESEYVKELE